MLSKYDCSQLLNELSSSPAGGVLALVLARLTGSLWRRGRGSRGLAGCATCQTHATGNENLHVCLFFCLFGGSCCTQAAHIIAFYLFFRSFQVICRFTQYLGRSRCEGEDFHHGIEHHHDPVSSQANTSDLRFLLIFYSTHHCSHSGGTSVENSSSMTIFFLRSSQTQTLFPGYL